MCEPTLMLMAATTAIQGVSAKRAAEDEIDLRNEQLTKQNAQATSSASMTKFERARQAEAERAKLRVSAAESGIGGITADTLLMDSFFQEGFDNSLTQYNLENRIDAQQTEARMRNTQTANSAPSLFETGLAIAGQTAGYYADRPNKTAPWESD